MTWLRAAGKESLISVAALCVLLTVAFEFSIGRFVFRRPWVRLAPDYNIFKGGPPSHRIGLAVLALSQLIAVRMRPVPEAGIR